MCGYIKLYRKLTEWRWYDEPLTKAVFIDLLLNANFETKKWREMTIERGQIFTSRTQLAKSNGISLQNVRTAINRLKTTGEITCSSTGTGLLITICEYDSYQGYEKKVQPTNEPTNKPDANREVTDNQPEDNLRTTTTKEGKKERRKEGNNEKKEKIKDGIFEKYWDEYHKITGKIKTDKEATEKYWKKLTDEEKQLAIDKIPDYVASISDSKYIKKARTYLADKNFNDEFRKPDESAEPTVKRDLQYFHQIYDIPGDDLFGYTVQELTQRIESGCYPKHKQGAS